MKTIGLIGGMSWESTQSYYQVINQSIKQKLGGLHSAKVILFSVDFAEIAALQNQGDWQGAGEILADAAHKLSLIGADAIVVCTNAPIPCIRSPRKLRRVLIFHYCILVMQQARD